MYIDIVKLPILSPTLPYLSLVLGQTLQAQETQHLHMEFPYRSVVFIFPVPVYFILATQPPIHTLFSFLNSLELNLEVLT